MGQESRASGFTIVELLVSIGVILVLIGLLMPALGKARERSKSLRTTIAVRSSARAIDAYAGDSDGVYPIAHWSVQLSMLDWDSPIVSQGYITSEAQIDPDGTRERGHHRFAMSGALVHPWKQMEPGAVLPLELAEAKSVRQPQVAFPSSKGMLVRWVQAKNGEEHFWTWEPFDRPLAPIAFCDGSVSEHRCTDFVLAHEFFEYWVGHPVLATWSGSNGLDRLH
ncbi:MAG: type II secretion system protein [Planctomycetota bacterium]|nr:MAG: type II secretion system protein [Planctomycetota bacterium]